MSNHAYLTPTLASITTFLVSVYILSGSERPLYLVGAGASFVLLLLLAMRDIKKGDHSEGNLSMDSAMCSYNSFYYSHHFNHGIPMDRLGFPCITILIHGVI